MTLPLVVPLRSRVRDLHEPQFRERSECEISSDFTNVSEVSESFLRMSVISLIRRSILKSYLHYSISDAASLRSSRLRNPNVSDISDILCTWTPAVVPTDFPSCPRLLQLQVGRTMDVTPKSHLSSSFRKQSTSFGSPVVLANLHRWARRSWKAKAVADHVSTVSTLSSSAWASPRSFSSASIVGCALDLVISLFPHFLTWSTDK